MSQVAEADLLTAETNLKKATIRSPIDGVVMSRAVEPGQTVAASLQAPVLFTIAENLASMQLEVDVDEADVGQVQRARTRPSPSKPSATAAFPAKVDDGARRAGDDQQRRHLHGRADASTIPTCCFAPA